MENAIDGHPVVAEVAVIGVPDNAQGGEGDDDPEAACSSSEASIIAWARERIGGFKVPKSVDFVAALPRNATGRCCGGCCGSGTGRGRSGGSGDW